MQLLTVVPPLFTSLSLSLSLATEAAGQSPQWYCYPSVRRWWSKSAACGRLCCKQVPNVFTCPQLSVSHLVSTGLYWGAFFILAHFYEVFFSLSHSLTLISCCLFLPDWSPGCSMIVTRARWTQLWLLPGTRVQSTCSCLCMRHSPPPSSQLAQSQGTYTPTLFWCHVSGLGMWLSNSYNLHLHYYFFSVKALVLVIFSFSVFYTSSKLLWRLEMLPFWN